MKLLNHIGKNLFNYIAVFVSIFSLLIAIKSCNDSDESLKISKAEFESKRKILWNALKDTSAFTFNTINQNIVLLEGILTFPDRLNHSEYFDKKPITIYNEELKLKLLSYVRENLSDSTKFYYAVIKIPILFLTKYLIENEIQYDMSLYEIKFDITYNKYKNIEFIFDFIDLKFRERFDEFAIDLGKDRLNEMWLSEEYKIPVNDSSYYYHRDSYSASLKLEYEKSLVLAEKALAFNKENSSALAMKAYSFGGLKKYDSSLMYFDRAIKLDPFKTVFWNNKGWIYLQMGKFEEALSSFDVALFINKKYHYALSNKAETYFKLGKVTQALTFIDSAISMSHSYQGHKYRKIKYLLENSNLKSAKEVLKLIPSHERFLTEKNLFKGIIFALEDNKDSAKIYLNDSTITKIIESEFISKRLNHFITDYKFN